MFNKGDMLKRLRADPMFRKALEMAQSDEDRRRIIAASETLLVSFIDALAPVSRMASNDPNFAMELHRSVQNTGQIVSERDGRSVVSGSNS